MVSEGEQNGVYTDTEDTFHFVCLLVIAEREEFVKAGEAADQAIALYFGPAFCESIAAVSVSKTHSVQVCSMASKA